MSAWASSSAMRESDSVAMRRPRLNQAMRSLRRASSRSAMVRCGIRGLALATRSHHGARRRDGRGVVGSSGENIEGSYACADAREGDEIWRAAHPRQGRFPCTERNPREEALRRPRFKKARAIIVERATFVKREQSSFILHRDAVATVCTKGAESRPPGRCGQPRSARVARYCPGGGPRQGWRGAKRNAAQRHPIGLSLDGEPPGSRVQRAEAWADAILATRARAGKAPREAQSGQERSPGNLVASGANPFCIQHQASARGTDAERASH